MIKIRYEGLQVQIEGCFPVRITREEGSLVVEINQPPPNSGTADPSAACGMDLAEATSYEHAVEILTLRGMARDTL